MNEAKSVGGAWKNVSKAGLPYISCVVELEGKKVKLVLFETQKKSEKHPDWNVILSN